MVAEAGPLTICQRDFAWAIFRCNLIQLFLMRALACPLDLPQIFIQERSCSSGMLTFGSADLHE